jgi:integrase
VSFDPVPVSSLPADRNPAAVYLARLGPGSRRTMRQALDVVAVALTGGQGQGRDGGSLEWSALRYQHTQAVRAALAGAYAPATVNKMLSAMRGVLKEAWRLGLMSAEDYQRAADVQVVRNETMPKGRALTPGELSALLAACEADSGPAGARDAAMLALLYGGGLRRSEAVGLDLADYNPETGAVTIRRAKGGKDRTGYATNGAAVALADWLTVRGSEPGPLFLAVNKSGRVIAHGLTGQAVLYVLARRATQANVARLSPHDLRRTFVSHLLDAGADIVTVQKLAGHANVQTTARYDRRGEVEKRRAAELLHVPYRGKAGR